MQYSRNLFFVSIQVKAILRRALWICVYLYNKITFDKRQKNKHTSLSRLTIDESDMFIYSPTYTTRHFIIRYITNMCGISKVLTPGQI